VPLVRMPPIVKTVPVTDLHGQVIGPTGVPVPGAQVALPEFGLATRTDIDGHFRFRSVPTEGPAPTLRVRAKGQDHSFATEGKVGFAEGLVVRLTVMEG